MSSAGQFDMAEGDPFTPGQQRRAKQSLEDLGFFSTATVDTAPGSAPDKLIVNTTVSEKPTGELTLGGGYSTDAGILGNAGLRQKKPGRHRYRCEPAGHARPVRELGRFPR